MEEKRLYNRFDPVVEISGVFELIKEVTGGFRNFEEFIIKDISLGGFNLLSSFNPKIGDEYSVFINYNKEKIEFSIRIVFSRIHKLIDKPERFFRSGPLLSIGCKIISCNDKQKDLLVHIIKNDCEFPKKIEPPKA